MILFFARGCEHTADVGVLGGVEEEWGVLLFADAVGFVGAEKDGGGGHGG